MPEYQAMNFASKNSLYVTFAYPPLPQISGFVSKSETIFISELRTKAMIYEVSSCGDKSEIVSNPR